MLSISLRFHCLSPDMLSTAFSHVKPPRNIHAAREVTLSDSKNNLRRITYGIGFVWGMRSLSPLSSLVPNSSRRVWREASHTIDCSMKKQPISTAVVLEFIELLKWIKKSYWSFSESSECKHICHCDRFIFYLWLWVFHNSNKSKLLTLIKNSFVQLF